MDLDSILRRNPFINSKASQTQAGRAKRRAIQALNRLTHVPFLRKTIQRLYNFLFEYYAQ
jgi:hypothetical protein